MPKILDLFCGGGGASMGYHRAGFEVCGMDNVYHPRYPFDFSLGDAINYLKYIVEHSNLNGIDAIHTSPPCQAYSKSTKSRRNKGITYPDLLGETRELLEKTGLPWIIENTPGAPMRADYTLCGSQFGLKVVRHRLFEVSWGPTNWQMPPCSHPPDVVTICGHGTPSWTRKRRAALGLVPNVSVDEKRKIMECEWMNREELSQAIPPTYTEFIGKELLKCLGY